MPSLPRLQSIDLTHNPLSTKGGAHLHRLLAPSAAHLRTLLLSHTAVSDAGAASVATLLVSHPCPALEKVDLSFCGITAEGAARLAMGLRHNGVPTLHTLVLSGNPLREVCKRALNNVSALPGNVCADARG
jgi:Ran GTPase-activating protein (RanGAP) involved in mRNA processing and transport